MLTATYGKMKKMFHKKHQAKGDKCLTHMYTNSCWPLWSSLWYNYTVKTHIVQLSWSYYLSPRIKTKSGWCLPKPKSLKQNIRRDNLGTGAYSSWHWARGVSRSAKFWSCLLSSYPCPTYGWLPGSGVLRKSEAVSAQKVGKQAGQWTLSTPAYHRADTHPPSHMAINLSACPWTF